MTGSVTFNADGEIIQIELTSGLYTINSDITPARYWGAHFVVVSGVITQWDVASPESFTCGITGQAACAMSTDNIGDHFDKITQVCFGCPGGQGDARICRRR